MSESPFEPPLTPAAPQPNGGIGGVHRRELTPQELATLPVQALLVRTGQLTLDQLSEALRENVATGQSVEEIAVGRGWVSAEELYRLREQKAQYAPRRQSRLRRLLRPFPLLPLRPSRSCPNPHPPRSSRPFPIRHLHRFSPSSRSRPGSDARARHGLGPRGLRERRLSACSSTSRTASASGSAGSRTRRPARLHAQHLINALVRPEPGVWPRFGDRLVRPDSVVGVEVVPRTD